MQVALCLHFVACVFSLVPLLHLCTLLGKKHANKNVNKCGKKKRDNKAKTCEHKVNKKATNTHSYSCCCLFCLLCLLRFLLL